ncbi:hypothetical protein CsSME_00006234 [Camellia sinensis var. sinensis]
MALTATKVSKGSVAIDATTVNTLQGSNYIFAKSPQHTRLHGTSPAHEFGKQSDGHLWTLKLKFPKKVLWHVCGKPSGFVLSRGLSAICRSTNTSNTETQECIRDHGDCSESSSGMMRLDARVRQDVAIIGSEFLKLDARARKDTKKIDHDVKKKAERLNHIAAILKDKAQSRLKKAADKHWSDGALEADLRRADFFAKQRAMEDALMALEFVKNIHDMMVSKMCKLKRGSQSTDGMVGRIMIEKNGKTLDFFPGEVSTDRITAIQEAYWSMASALSEADGIDYTDPEELELLVATLIDLDAMDGKSSVSLLAECSSSPDVNTRKALANALAAAPSMWTLGNAGMGALQRLAEDSNPTIAAAASKAIYELKKQWEIEDGDSWRFMMNQKPIDGQKVDDRDAATE